MLTISLPITNEIPEYVHDYIREYSSVVRFAYNRAKDDDTLSCGSIEKIVSSTMINLTHLDASLMRNACIIGLGKRTAEIAKNKESGEARPMIFSRKQFLDRKKQGVVAAKTDTKVEFESKLHRVLPVMLIGSKSDPYGNRKAKLNIIEDNSILIKLDREHHFKIQLPKIRKKLKAKL